MLLEFFKKKENGRRLIGFHGGNRINLIRGELISLLKKERIQVFEIKVFLTPLIAGQLQL